MTTDPTTRPADPFLFTELLVAFAPMIEARATTARVANKIVAGVRRRLKETASPVAQELAQARLRQPQLWALALVLRTAVSEREKHVLSVDTILAWVSEVGHVTATEGALARLYQLELLAPTTDGETTRVGPGPALAPARSEGGQARAMKPRQAEIFGGPADAPPCLDSGDEAPPACQPIQDASDYLAVMSAFVDELTGEYGRDDETTFEREVPPLRDLVLDEDPLDLLEAHDAAHPDAPFPALARKYDLDPRSTAIIRLLLLDRIRCCEGSMGLPMGHLCDVTGQKTPAAFNACLRTFGPGSRLCRDGVIVHLDQENARPVDGRLTVGEASFRALLDGALDARYFLARGSGESDGSRTSQDDGSKLDPRPLILPEAPLRRLERAIEAVPLRARVAVEMGYRELVGYGLGSAMLFEGEPGTGKSLAAHVVAQRLQRPLVELCASNILDKYVGESEKRVTAAFAKAARTGAVLVFEEADSLLRGREGARSHEISLVNTILREIERFDGVVIFTTNLVDHLDPALERRLSLRLRFPKPGPVERHAIWRALTRDRIEFDADVDLEGIAQRVPLTGGEIKNAVLDLATRVVAREPRVARRQDIEDAIAEARAGKWGVEAVAGF